MLSPASVKGVIRSKENDALRSPELVDRVWDDAVDGAWAPGKAPLPLLSAFLQHVQDEDMEQAEQTAQAILAVEPQNRLVQDLVAAMKQHLALEDQLESEEESEEEEEEEEEEGEDDENEEEGEEDEEEDEAPEIDRDEK